MAQTLLSAGVGAALVVTQAAQLSADALGVWQAFLSIASFMLLIGQGGLTPTVQRFASYLYAGASNLSSLGIPETTSTSPNWGGIAQFVTANHWLFLRIAVVCSLIIGIALACFIEMRVHDQVLRQQSWWCLPFFICGLFFLIINAPQVAIVQGCGGMLASQRILVAATVVNAITTLGSLWGNLGVISLGFGYFSMALVQYFAHAVYIKRFLNLGLRNAPTDRHLHRSEILHALWPTTWRFSLTVLGAWAINASGTIMLAWFDTLEQAGRYGISMQVLAVLTSISGTWMRTATPALCTARVQQRTDLLYQLYLSAYIKGVLVFVSLSTVFLTLAPHVFTWFSLRMPFLEFWPLLTLTTITFLEFHHGPLCASLFLTANQVPYVRAALWSGFAIIVASYILVHEMKWGVWGILAARGIVQAAYNNWKWPWLVWKELSTNVSVKN
ncbi:MAG: hypothetical protein N3B15_05905 [Planctomycetota bacterium]|nr:hypothetical protein [Planctomycetota bacterium]